MPPDVAPAPGLSGAPGRDRGVRQKHYKALELLRQLAELSARVEAIVFEARHLCGCKTNNHLAAPRDLPEEMKRAFDEERTRRLEEVMTKTALSVLRAVMGHKFAYPFNQPVDITTYTEYPKVIKNPMDFGTIRDRLEGGRHYKQAEEIWSDIQLVISNAQTFNPAGSDVHVMAQTLYEKAQELWERDMYSKIAAEQAWATREEATRRKAYAETLTKMDSNAMQHQALQLFQIIEELERNICEVKAAAAAACENLTLSEAEELSAALRRLNPRQVQAAIKLVGQRSGITELAEDVNGFPARKVSVSLSEYDAVTLRQLQLLVAKSEQADSAQPAAIAGPATAQPAVVAHPAAVPSAPPPPQPAACSAQTQPSQLTAAGAAAAPTAAAEAAGTPVTTEDGQGAVPRATAGPTTSTLPSGLPSGTDSGPSAAAGSQAEPQARPDQSQSAAEPAAPAPAPVPQPTDLVTDNQPTPMDTQPAASPEPPAQADVAPARLASEHTPTAAAAAPPTRLVLPDDLLNMPNASPGAPLQSSPFAAVSSQGLGGVAAGAQHVAPAQGPLGEAGGSETGHAAATGSDALALNPLPQPGVNMPIHVNGMTVVRDPATMPLHGEEPWISQSVSAAIGAVWPGLPLGAGVRPGARVQVRTGEQQQLSEGWEGARRTQAARNNHMSQQYHRQRKHSLTPAGSVRKQVPPQEVPPPPPPPPPAGASTGGLASFPAPPLQPPPAAPGAYTPMSTPGPSHALLSPYPMANSNSNTPQKIGMKRKATAGNPDWPGTLEIPSAGSLQYPGSGQHLPSAFGFNQDAHHMDPVQPPPSKASRKQNKTVPHEMSSQHHLQTAASMLGSATSASRAMNDLAGQNAGEMKLLLVPSTIVPPGASVTATSPGSAPAPPAMTQVLNLSAQPSATAPTASGALTTMPSGGTGVAASGTTQQGTGTAADARAMGTVPVPPPGVTMQAVPPAQPISLSASPAPPAAGALPSRSSVEVSAPSPAPVIPAAAAASVGVPPSGTPPPGAQGSSAAHPPPIPAQLATLAALGGNPAALAVLQQHPNALALMRTLHQVQAASSGAGAGTGQHPPPQLNPLLALLQQHQNQQQQQQSGGGQGNPLGQLKPTTSGPNLLAISPLNISPLTGLGAPSGPNNTNINNNLNNLPIAIANVRPPAGTPGSTPNSSSGGAAEPPSTTGASSAPQISIPPHLLQSLLSGAGAGQPRPGSGPALSPPGSVGSSNPLMASMALQNLLQAGQQAGAAGSVQTLLQRLSAGSGAAPAASGSGAPGVTPAAQVLTHLRSLNNVPENVVLEVLRRSQQQHTELPGINIPPALQGLLNSGAGPGQGQGQGPTGQQTPRVPRERRTSQSNSKQ